MDIRKLVPSGILGAIIGKVTRWAATAAAAAVASWLYALLQKYGLPADGQLGDLVKEVAAGVSAVILGLGALAFSVWDAKKVDGKITVAAAAGVSQGQAIEQAKAQGAIAQHDADQAHVDAVATAVAIADKATPKNKDELLAALAAESK